VTQLLISHGLILLFALVALESTGVPLPGEAALITAAGLSERGHYPIASVIAVAATAAILGDNLGYWIGRKGGRGLLKRWSLLDRFAKRVLPASEKFFDRHGAKTVFFGRFVAVLRITAAWLAGVGKMPWWRFFAFNAAGGIVWATSVSLIAYFFGKAAADAIARYGALGAGAAVVVVLLVLGGVHVWRKRVLQA